MWCSLTACPEPTDIREIHSDQVRYFANNDKFNLNKNKVVAFAGSNTVMSGKLVEIGVYEYRSRWTALLAEHLDAAEI